MLSSLTKPLLKPVLSSLFAGVALSALAGYAANGIVPALVADFVNRVYAVDGTITTFDAMFPNYTGPSVSTFHDSSGNKVFNPHNLAINSASPATQSITVQTGAKYTVNITGSGSVALTGAGTGTVTDGNPVEITASTTSLTLTVTGSPSTMWAHRSDLPMADNPVTGNSYVPTDASAVYMAREGRHVYNGSAWVNKGIQIESAAIDHILLDNMDPTTSNWVVKTTNATQDQIGIGGEANTAWTLEDDNLGGYERNVQEVTVANDSNTYTCATFIGKDDDETRFPEFKLTLNNGTSQTIATGLNTKTGAITDRSIIGTASSEVIDLGDWWLLVQTLANNGTGNTELRYDCWPARALTIGGTDNSATGSIVWGGCDAYQSDTLQSFMPTYGSTVTRAAQTLPIPAANMPAYTDAVSIKTKGLMTYEDDDTSLNSMFFRWQEASTDLIRAYLDTSTTRTGRITAQQEVGNIADYVSTGNEDLAPGIDQAFNFATRHTQVETNIAVDGSAATANTTPTDIVDLSAEDFELAQDGSFTIEQLVVWPSDIGDAGIVEASS